MVNGYGWGSWGGLGYYPAWGFFDFQSIIYQWAAIGMFDLILPMILVFTIVFAILQEVGFLGRHRGTNAIIALAVALLAISNSYVTAAFKYIFAYTGLGLIVLISVMLLLALFFPREEGMFKMPGWFIVIGAVIFLWAISRAINAYYGYAFVESWLSRNLGIVYLVGLALIIIVIATSYGKPAGKEIVIRPGKT